MDLNNLVNSLYTAIQTNNVTRLLLEAGGVPTNFINGAPLLYHAVELRNIEISKMLLTPLNVNLPTCDSIYPLHSASVSYSMTEIKLLFNQYNGHVNLKEYIAVNYNSVDRINIQLLKLLLSHGAAINAVTRYGATCLHLASSSASYNTVKLLLNYGADLHALTHYNETALHYAVSSDNIEVVKLLIEEGIDINVKNKDNTTALQIAIELQSEDLIKVLLENNAEINIIGQHRYMLQIHETLVVGEIAEFIGEASPGSVFLCTYMMSPLCDMHRLSALSKLIFRHDSESNFISQTSPAALSSYLSGTMHLAAVSKILTNNYTDECFVPLLYLIQHGSLKLVQLLLVSGANPNLHGNAAFPPLHYATILQHSSIIQLLIANHVNLDSKDAFGNTAMHYSCKSDTDITMTQLLLEAGAALSIKDTAGRTALHVACSTSEAIHTAKLLVAHNDIGTNINIPDLRNMTPLYYAVRLASLSLCRLLLQAGADPNIASSGDYPLLYAVKSNNIRITRLLLEYKANIANITQFSLIYYLIRMQRKKMLKVILEFDFNLATLDYNTTPCLLTSAIQHFGLEMIALFLKKGIKLNRIINSSSTSFTAACTEHPDKYIILQFLVANIAYHLYTGTINEGDKINIRFIRSHVYLSAYYDKCIKELVLMNQVKIGNKYTLLHIYTYNDKNNINYNGLARCSNFLANIHITSLLSIYAVYIKKSIDMTLKRAKLLFTCIKIFNRLWPGTSLWALLPFEIQYCILEYLSSAEILHLSQNSDV